MSEQFENNNVDVELTTDSAAEEPVAEETPAAPKARPVTRRYNKHGKRRGKFAYAAPVGFLVSLLSIIGVIAIIVNVVGFIQKKNDDTALKQELYYYLEPLLIYSPEPFDNAAKEEQDAFLNAAAYRVYLAEQNRMLHEKDEYPQYPVDENFRIAVPVKEVDKAYDALFGKKAKLTHRTIEGSGVEYSEGDGCYYIPFVPASIGYEIVIDKVTQRAKQYEVRVGFVPVTDIEYDEHGNAIAPTADQATHFQTYTLTRNKKAGTYYIKSCKDEKK